MQSIDPVFRTASQVKVTLPNEQPFIFKPDRKKPGYMKGRKWKNTILTQYSPVSIRRIVKKTNMVSIPKAWHLMLDEPRHYKIFYIQEFEQNKDAILELKPDIEGQKFTKIQTTTYLSLPFHIVNLCQSKLVAMHYDKYEKKILMFLPCFDVTKNQLHKLFLKYLHKPASQIIFSLKELF